MVADSLIPNLRHVVRSKIFLQLINDGVGRNDDDGVCLFPASHNTNIKEPFVSRPPGIKEDFPSCNPVRKHLNEITYHSASLSFAPSPFASLRLIPNRKSKIQ